MWSYTVYFKKGSVINPRLAIVLGSDRCGLCRRRFDEQFPVFIIACFFWNHFTSFRVGTMSAGVVLRWEADWHIIPNCRAESYISNV